MLPPIATTAEVAAEIRAPAVVAVAAAAVVPSAKPAASGPR
jgi:hypothetical protein